MLFAAIGIKLGENPLKTTIFLPVLLIAIILPRCYNVPDEEKEEKL
jgi:hypothetical protein